MERLFRQLTVPFSRSAARTARAELLRQLRSAAVGQGVMDDAAVVLSELVTNAVSHAAPTSSGRVDVEWAMDRHQLWLRVSDGGQDDGDRVRHRTPVGGRGLSIVAALADAWDFDRHAGGTTVTAVFELG